MTRKHCSKKERKLMKFRDNYDEDFCWEDHLETREIRRKGKKNHRKNSDREKW